MNVEVDKQTAELVRLAQRELHGDSVLSDEAGFSRLEARMAQPRGVGLKRWLAGGFAVAAVAALVALFLLEPRTHALTFEVVAGSLGESGRIVATDRTHIRFSDGSEASLSNGTEAKIQNLSEHGADVVLASGSMRVHIARKPRASWKIAAGPYDVRVTGTAFNVSWSKQTQAFDLRMETGAVIVTGPLAQGGIPLKAGQHLFVADGRLTVEGGETPSLVSPSPVAALEPLPESEAPRQPSGASPSPSSVSSAATSHSSSDGTAWPRQVAEGHFNAVLEQAERRGFERTLASGSPDELAALADAARYAGRSPVAKRVLLAQRHRFPGSGAAKDAAFFLGRIAEDDGSGGSEWYERYVSESPRGTYASQAYGRKMMLLYKQRGAAAAKAAADDYLSRYPNGPYAAAARKLAQESSAQKP